MKFVKADFNHKVNEEGDIMMTQQEMAFDIAKRYLHGSDKEKEIILSCFTEDEKKVFLDFAGYFKLFCDQKFYDAVKKAVCGQLLKEIYG